MKKLIITCFLILPFTVFSQVVEEWSQTFGGNGEEWGRSVIQTDDGGYIIGGYTNYFYEFSELYLIKTDPNGQELWSRTYGGTYGVRGGYVQKTDDGGYIILGSTESGDVYLIKTDQNGQELWSQTYGGTGDDDGSIVQKTDDGGYIIVGSTTSFSNPNTWYSIYLIKTDSNGQELWSQSYGSVGSYRGSSLLHTDDGGYLIFGYSNSTHPYDLYLVKTNESGQELWSQKYDCFDFVSVQKTDDGGYIIVGNQRDQCNNEGDDSNISLIKISQNGQELWRTMLGGTCEDYGGGIQITDDGGYLIVGETGICYMSSGTSGDSDVYLIKTDGNGQELWSQTFGDSGDNGVNNIIGQTITETEDGGWIVLGYTGSYINRDIYLIKLGSNNTSTEEVVTPNQNRKIEKTIDVWGREIKSQPNLPLIEIYDDGSVEKRIIID